ncbi:Oxo-4-hydroxy-4-carboxy-5-ureidoimidazoline decarboxylase [Mycena amicta]|nr:Oxo-4-hydroxy-4-carboxy-5-ureidoimidazoline decarboxylase [Mycena amicta]
MIDVDDGILAVLLEPSDTLAVLAQALQGRVFPSYDELIDAAIAQVELWPKDQRAAFIKGHPRIGESSAVLSSLSAKEQGAVPTAPDVLARLAHLNACYEHVYPGLRYVTFVNGRTRPAIALEIEDVLCIPHSLSPDTPPLHTLSTTEAGSQVWLSELDRAVQDVGRIAKSRAVDIRPTNTASSK